MSRLIPDSHRQKVAKRAGFRCEYCLLSESVSFYVFHIDHIKSLKHRGTNGLNNLAWCCPDCNFFKGADLGTFLEDDDEHLVRFYNPRKDIWSDHFAIEKGAIVAKTPIGKATARILKFNHPDRLIFRRQLFELGQYP